ncbi:hypothetical protein Aperf_G00000125043 [Anoplocephala perfoliata]
MQSALQMNPGLSHLPNPDLYTSLLYFRPREPLPHYQKSDELAAYLHAHQDNTGSTKLEDCVQEGGYKQDPERPCTFDLNAGGPCNIQKSYGFDTGQACIVLKMNRIYGWLPDPIDEFATGVLVKCSGVTADDTFNLGTIRYYDMDYKFAPNAPALGPGKLTNGSFHSMYYPYKNQLAYLQPVVFVMFDALFCIPSSVDERDMLQHSWKPESGILALEPGRPSMEDNDRGGDNFVNVLSIFIPGHQTVDAARVETRAVDIALISIFLMRTLADGMSKPVALKLSAYGLWIWSFRFQMPAEKNGLEHPHSNRCGIRERWVRGQLKNQSYRKWKPTYNQLLLSTLGRDHDYAVNIYQRLHRRHFAHVTPESLLEETRGGDAEEEKAKKKGYSLKRGSVFKVPLLSHSSKNIGSGGASMANAATSGLMKMGGVVKKGFHKEKKERFKHGSMNTTKSAASTLNIRRGHKKKSATNAGERHSVAEIEQLASRMSAAATLGGPIRRGTPSESSHSLSEDGFGGESPSSSLSIDGGIQRISSQSSLLARTQELLDQYLAPPPVIRSPSLLIDPLGLPQNNN